MKPIVLQGLLCISLFSMQLGCGEDSDSVCKRPLEETCDDGPGCPTNEAEAVALLQTYCDSANPGILKTGNILCDNGKRSIDARRVDLTGKDSGGEQVRPSIRFLFDEDDVLIGTSISVSSSHECADVGSVEYFDESLTCVLASDNVDVCAVLNASTPK